MVIRNLPQIEPSSDFFARLSERLKDAPPPLAAHRTSSVVTTFVAVSAALAAAVYFAMGVGLHRTPPAPQTAVQTVAARPESVPESLSEATLVAAVPAGVPVWPAMFMVGELPMHLANVELVDNGIGR